MDIMYFLVAFLASTVGAICGIGGGVLMKPVLDMLQVGSTATINFLSGCTVLAMSLYSVLKSLRAGEKKVNMATGTPLAIGAAIGGVAGKELFSLIRSLFADPAAAGGVQAVCLGIVTLATLVYTVCKGRIPTRRIASRLFCLAIGLALGVMSSFLGIGGGPMNLVVLGFCFSMDSKTAATNSLYIILFSQGASLLTTWVTGAVPEFSVPALVLMVAGGIGGGILGRKLNQKMDNRAVDKLFMGLMLVIVGICVYNSLRAFL